MSPPRTDILVKLLEILSGVPLSQTKILASPLQDKVQ